MVFRALLLLVLGACPALAYPEIDPTAGDVHVGLQCDSAANRALVRLGGTDFGVRGGYIALPPQAPRSNAPIVEVDVVRDAVCRLGDGTEIRLRLIRSDASTYGTSCIPHYITLWVAARRVLKRVPVTRCGEPHFATTWGFQPAGRIGWVVTPSRIEVCRRPAPPVAGPDVQCRIAGDPRLMGIRDWVQYPADGRQPREGAITILHARDADFCTRFVVRGPQGMPDRFALPAFGASYQGVIDLDDYGRLVLIWRRVPPDGTIPPSDARSYFIHVIPQPGGVARIHDSGPDGKIVCEFQQGDGDDDDDR
jgi:hypothetical protein